MYGQPVQAGAYDPSMGGAQPGYAAGPPPAGYGQPPAMYDPSMGQPPNQPHQPQGLPPVDQLGKAEAMLAGLEDEKQKEEEKHKKKEIDHLSKTMRADARVQKDNQVCAKILCIWAVFNALCWAIPLLGDSWWNKTWQGMGVDNLQIGVGLFNMEINVQCKTDILNAERICHAIEKYSKHDGGHWSTAEIQEEMCKVNKASCPSMNRLYYSGFIPLVLFPTAAALECLAMMLLWFYWHGKPTALVRQMATKCGILAPVAGIFGFCGWLITSPYLHELPRFWAQEAGHKKFADNPLVGLSESFMFPMGWCCCIAFFGALSSIIRFFIQFTMPRHVNEPDEHGFDESSRLVEEAERMYDGEKGGRHHH